MHKYKKNIYAKFSVKMRLQNIFFKKVSGRNDREYKPHVQAYLSKYSRSLGKAKVLEMAAAVEISGNSRLKALC